MRGQLWIEPVGKIIVARVRGVPTKEMLREAQTRILQLVEEAAYRRILYDALEMEVPSVDVPLMQEKLDREIQGMGLRRAIVVPNSKLAYLARLAFGDQDYRVFYNDLATAVSWLGEGESTPR